ncbi:2TM domain-containing protein [Flagellimonas pacifica]|uniref:2TM domain-containing protein n=1 Tax=Flagellimonas pacifica TaxID=1247520 RepID=A0A285MXH9_9FLAO|nr:2TM domain-containing protein [Allomuricauda parva]SNZ00516.1 2TM domain-containing protein [Allomuricauda parva]
MRDSDKYEKAKKRVKELKGFYNHLKIFIIVNGVLYLLKSGWLTSFMPKGFPTESYYFDWIHSNLILWGLIVAVHALILFRHKFPFLKKWEERQIQKYMDQDSEESGKYK